MKNIRYLRALMLTKTCKMIKMNIFYHTQYGYKMAKGKDQPIYLPDSCDTEFCSADLLYLGPDGLYDQYTNTGKNIKNSPHYELIDACANDNLAESNYLRLEELGALDSRDSIFRPIERHLAAYIRAKNQIQNETYNPVLYYEINGIKYIYDGKHRAAMCAYLGIEVKCIKITPSSICSDYYISLSKEIKKNPNRYSLQASIVNSITSRIKN